MTNSFEAISNQSKQRMGESKQAIAEGTLGNRVGHTFFDALNQLGQIPHKERFAEISPDVGKFVKAGIFGVSIRREHHDFRGTERVILMQTLKNSITASPRDLMLDYKHIRHLLPDRIDALQTISYRDDLASLVREIILIKLFKRWIGISNKKSHG
jgi:hypothetical protein